jgi:hypothetical protein
LTGGVQDLPPFRRFENREVLPRAFVVPDAAPLAERRAVLRQLKTTDFRREVLLEAWDDGPRPDRSFSSSFSATASIRDYHPNRVVVDTDGSGPGYLVLTDVWFPGWTCTVDGEPARLYRANYLFRAVALPPGCHRIVFAFTPHSYTLGKYLSLLSLMGVLILIIGSWLVSRRHQSPLRFPFQSLS